MVNWSLKQVNAFRQAILTIVAAFTLTFTGCGLNFAFGVYQELYETIGGPFQDVSPAQIDLIGTLAVSLMTIGAPFASAWTKSYGPCKVTMLGATLFAAGNILASFGTQLWHFILAQGVLLGCGTCLTYIPSVTVAPGWFDKRRGLALGIALSGTGVGGLVWAPTLRACNSYFGFRNTLRLTGGVSFALICTAGFVLKWDPDSQKRNELNSRGNFKIPLVNWNIAKSRMFVVKATAATVQAAAYYTPIYFFSSYARSLGFSAIAGANFIALSNGLSAAGKVILGYAADRYGRLNVLVICTLISALSILTLWLPSSLLGGSQNVSALFISFTILYGITAGVYVSLFPTVLAEIFGVQHFASINGFLYMLRGLGTLVGTPVAGALIRSGTSTTVTKLPSNFTSCITMAGVLLTVASMAVFYVRLEAVKPVGWRWKM
jgi:MFS family permease